MRSPDQDQSRVLARAYGRASAKVASSYPRLAIPLLAAATVKIGRLPHSGTGCVWQQLEGTEQIHILTQYMRIPLRNPVAFTNSQ